MTVDVIFSFCPVQGVRENSIKQGDLVRSGGGGKHPHIRSGTPLEVDSKNNNDETSVSIGFALGDVARSHNRVISVSVELYGSANESVGGVPRTSVCTFVFSSVCSERRAVNVRRV